MKIMPRSGLLRQCRGIPEFSKIQGDFRDEPGGFKSCVSKIARACAPAVCPGRDLNPGLSLALDRQRKPATAKGPNT